MRKLRWSKGKSYGISAESHVLKRWLVSPPVVPVGGDGAFRKWEIRRNLVTEGLY